MRVHTSDEDVCALKAFECFGIGRAVPHGASCTAQCPVEALVGSVSDFEGDTKALLEQRANGAPK